MNKDIIKKKRKKSEPDLYDILMDITILTETHSNYEIVLHKRKAKILNRYITKLQNNILSLKEENMEKDLKLIGIQENTESNMKEIIDKYYVDKQKVKDVIYKYIMEYEKEKEYRFTDDVEIEQEILKSIENEILEGYKMKEYEETKFNSLYGKMVTNKKEDVTKEYENMIHAFECDFSIAFNYGDYSIFDDLKHLYESKNKRLLNDTEKLQELCFGLRYGILKIYKVN